MADRSQHTNFNPEVDPNDASQMKDPVQAGSSDMDERMNLLTPTPAQDYKEAIDKSNLIDEERLRRAAPQSSTAYHEPSEEENDISWRPDPSGHPRRTFQ
ncbi:hypothetical protein N7537_009240 [Penicillium hordei]|uniref:Uncharacterized protein n=1 Tax=Penicillium hordei TaxID=40994 RepID=A0AAD6GUL3_9EURO|nr:uncharacterized protein N7537_009240 [Penicillium hordei]KAJ5592336.1 hypothetical protein N7537_009240 [Penicillium hordei]